MARPLRLALGVWLLLFGLIWYAHVARLRGGDCFPHELPIQLCDLVLWLTVAGLFSLSQTVLELAYFWGMSGSVMALLTPDLGRGAPMFAVCTFFILHGGVVASLLFLTGSGIFRPRPGSPLRALLGLNLYLAGVAGVNAAFNTNYFYICYKPSAPSLLDLMGPWPWYILWGELLACLLFSFLWLPFRRPAARTF